MISCSAVGVTTNIEELVWKNMGGSWKEPSIVDPYYRTCEEFMLLTNTDLLWLTLLPLKPMFVLKIADLI